MELNIAQLLLVTSDYCHRRETQYTKNYSKGKKKKQQKGEPEAKMGEK